MNKGKRIMHPIYGDGETVQDSQRFDSHQFTGEAVWCVFFNPQTGIAGGWPYMVPVNDLTALPAKSGEA